MAKALVESSIIKVDAVVVSIANSVQKYTQTEQCVIFALEEASVLGRRSAQPYFYPLALEFLCVVFFFFFGCCCCWVVVFFFFFWHLFPLFPKFLLFAQERGKFKRAFPSLMTLVGKVVLGILLVAGIASVACVVKTCADLAADN